MGTPGERKVQVGDGRGIDPLQWQFVESSEFRVSFDRIASQGHFEILRQIQALIIWLLEKDADVFPVVPGFESVRMVKTDTEPTLRILFRAAPGRIELLYIEACDQ